MSAKSKKIVIIGVLCAVFAALAAWFSLRFNEGRMVYLMDYSDYSFRWLDLPLWLSLVFCILYVAYLVFLLAKSLLSRRKPSRYTRTLNPWLGLLGLLGFLGFWGMGSAPVDGPTFPLAFFVFFGFFGFFFEGKMSGTFMDERFRENAAKAQLKAYKIGFALLFILVLMQGGQRYLQLSLEQSAIFMLSALSLILALVIFLSEYLLYRYDVLENQEENE